MVDLTADEPMQSPVEARLDACFGRKEYTHWGLDATPRGRAILEHLRHYANTWPNASASKRAGLVDVVATVVADAEAWHANPDWKAPTRKEMGRITTGLQTRGTPEDRKAVGHYLALQKEADMLAAQLKAAPGPGRLADECFAKTMQAANARRELRDRYVRVYQRDAYDPYDAL